MLQHGLSEYTCDWDETPMFVVFFLVGWLAVKALRNSALAREVAQIPVEVHAASVVTVSQPRPRVSREALGDSTDAAARSSSPLLSGSEK
mmetsp:Transcript_33756/g.53668  ORF Transcript_33756/g.53668 Transcript_33756/m.53668 type:complete len:90 (+) Transcript_33756:69-338(+)